MEKKIEGWVIINTNHPANPGNKMIIENTFSRKRTDAIKLFTEGSGSSWRYWKDEYNFRCVKAMQTITVEM